MLLHRENRINHARSAASSPHRGIALLQAMRADCVDRGRPDDTHALPPIPRGSRLGDRLRQLRVSAGLTQSDLAGERFSKEYVSQIERGKTRPTRETIKWLAARLGVDASFLASGVSSDERARAEAILTARRGAVASGATTTPRSTSSRTRSPPSSPPAPSSSRCGCSRARPGRGRTAARSGRRSTCSSRRAALVEGPSFTDLDRAEVLFRLGVAPLPDLEHRDGDRALRRGARRSSSARRFRPTCSARTSSPGARAATAASATTRRRARTSRARSSSRRRWTTRARSARSTSRRR